MNVKLIWATPDADNVVGYCARVSNPDNQDNPEVAGLLRYCGKNGHWSVFEMANVCVEVNTTRDIGRQILRHRSFQYQEFSGRYQSYDKLDAAPLRECRLQDAKNRQNSISIDPADDKQQVLSLRWDAKQAVLRDAAIAAYTWALEQGIAKEQARALLPEGLTTSRLYVNGNLRSWIHYLQSRLHPSTQKEHREIAEQVLEILKEIAPVTMKAFFHESI